MFSWEVIKSMRLEHAAMDLALFFAMAVGIINVFKGC
jgi:hypothetical protein